MTEYLTLEDLLALVDDLEIGPVRDVGLLDSAAHRPTTRLWGSDAYSSLDAKAAALIQSLVGNRALVDGNERLGWLGLVVFYGLNGVGLEVPDDDAYDFVISIADGSLSEVSVMAEQLQRWSRVVGPGWDGARNLGDLGGLPLLAGGRTEPGRVYRSAAPEWMTNRGWDSARAVGLTTVIDLRNEMERGRTDAHPVLATDAMAGIAVVHAPTEDPEDEEFLTECGPWLDHPRSWAPNLRLYPDKIARVLNAIAEAGPPVLIHCAGGRDRTGMIGSILLALGGATHESIVANYEAGFRGAAEHRGHGWSFIADTGTWVPQTDESWSEEELDAAVADRRPALIEWLGTFDVEAYLLDSGVSEATLLRLKQLLVS